MTDREREVERIYRCAMRRCDWMEYGGLALMVIGPMIIAVSLTAMWR